MTLAYDLNLSAKSIGEETKELHAEENEKFGFSVKHSFYRICSSLDQVRSGTTQRFFNSLKVNLKTRTISSILWSLDGIRIIYSPANNTDMDFIAFFSN